MSLLNDVETIRKDEDAQKKEQVVQSGLLRDIEASLTGPDTTLILEVEKQTAAIEQMSALLKEMLAILKGEPAGIRVEHSDPTVHTLEGEHVMPKCTLVKKSAGLKAKAPGKLAAGAAPDFVLQDNQDDTLTVIVVDGAGNPVDPATLAGKVTLTASSGDPAKVTVAVDPTQPLTAKESAVGPLTTPGTPVAVTLTLTWTDGSVGPFSVVDNVDVTNSPAGGVQIVHGTPTVH